MEALNPLIRLDNPSAGLALGKTPPRVGKIYTKGCLPKCGQARPPAAKDEQERPIAGDTPMAEQLSFSFEDPSPQANEPAKLRDTKAHPKEARWKKPSPHWSEKWAPLRDLRPPALGDRPATLRGCLAWLHQNMSPTEPQAREIAGAINTIIKVIHRSQRLTNEDLPADPLALRPILRDAMPAAIGVSRSRFDNAKALLNTLEIAIGWVSADVRSVAPLKPFWQDRLAKASALGASFSPMPPFFRFCDRAGIANDDISAETLELYEKWIAEETLGLYPRHTVNSVATTWRKLRRLLPDWPDRDLRVMSRKRQLFLPPGSFPGSFYKDLDGYLGSLREPDPLDRDYGRPLGIISINATRRAILRAATCLIKNGTPADSISNLAFLVQPSVYHSILKCLYAEGLPRLKAANSPSYWTRSAYDISGILTLLARRWVKVPPETLDTLLALHKRIGPIQTGLSERVQARLAEFMTDAERQELFQLPWRAFEMADKMLLEGDTIRASKLYETALALIIGLESSLRLGDLAKLDLKENFQRDRKGRVIKLVVRINKTIVIKWAEIDDGLAQRIERHVKYFRPYIQGHHESNFLFPSAGGRSRFPSSINRLLHNLVAQQLGKHFTAHLARHLAVDIILDANPANMALAQRQLGHRSLETTSRIYGSRATLASSQYFKKALREQAQRAETAHDANSPTRKRRR